jgi:heterodisulfide reductase subunit C
MKTRIEDRIEAVLDDTGAYRCVECGKCVAVCPMADMYPDFSITMAPRGIIKKALLSPAILSDKFIWYCTECNAGTEVCPAGVSCRDLIRGLRKLAVDEGLAKALTTCSHCGQGFMPVPVADYLKGRLKGVVFNYMDLCPFCRRKVYMRRNA